MTNVVKFAYGVYKDVLLMVSIYVTKYVFQVKPWNGLAHHPVLGERYDVCVCCVVWCLVSGRVGLCLLVPCLMLGSCVLVCCVWLRRCVVFGVWVWRWYIAMILSDDTWSRSIMPIYHDDILPCYIYTYMVIIYIYILYICHDGISSWYI